MLQHPALRTAMLAVTVATGWTNVAPQHPQNPTPGVRYSGHDACGPIPVLDPHKFPQQPDITNTWLPLTPGEQFTQDGIVTNRSGKHTHRIVTTVTDLTKVVDGVRGIVVWDEDFQDGKLQESEIFFDAQDSGRNVWLLGEYPAEVKGGKVTGAPSAWFGGKAGARPGITMQARPHTATPGYRQGFAPKVKFHDCAKTFATHQKATVPTGTYHNVLITDEWDPADPSGGHQRKFYAPGLGVIRTSPVGGNAREDLVLTTRSLLCDPDQMTRARNEARRLDQLSRQTPRAEKTLTVKDCDF